MFNEFPYTNFHELNLDWIIAEIKRLQNLGVLSVNGQTGEVILYQDARIQLPDVTDPQWNIYRGAAGLLSGIEFRPDGAYLILGTQRLKFLTRNDIPESAGVVSVNGKVGIVTLTGDNIKAADGDNLTVSEALDVVNDAIYDVSDALDLTREGIAIVADGTDHPAISANQYVYIKNNDFIEEGMYRANAAIGANVAITADMVTQLNKGAINDLLSKHNTSINTLTSDINSKLTTTQKSVAIVSDGNTHSVITSGQYVYIKNHNSIIEGLYKATTAIPANTAITSAMVSAVPRGGLNDLATTLKEELTTHEITDLLPYITSNFSAIVPESSRIIAIKMGAHIMAINFHFRATEGISTGTVDLTGVIPPTITTVYGTIDSINGVTGFAQYGNNNVLYIRTSRAENSNYIVGQLIFPI